MRNVEPESRPFPRQPSHVTAATIVHAPIDEPLEPVFFVESVQRLYQQSPYHRECPILQGEASHRKYNWLKLDGGQAYNLSSD
jgi:hypothetical protein